MLTNHHDQLTRRMIRFFFIYYFQWIQYIMCAVVLPAVHHCQRTLKSAFESIYSTSIIFESLIFCFFLISFLSQLYYR